ncbi:DUF6886 family protein [Paenibacillus filicis]|uniref:DUF6886 family protein n=1 Tax=Paenibacillus filicis TaxID=669464 RepID=A0ABU9DTW4_9BACL
MSSLLYHFSENPHIDVFIPLPASDPADKPVVWAIDEEHAVSYYFPRECPRIIVVRPTELGEDDAGDPGVELFRHTAASKIIWVERGWYERIRDVRLYRYTFGKEGFAVKDLGAGYYTSAETVHPVTVEPMPGLIGCILASGAELRFTPNLYPIHQAVLESRALTEFSMIRMRNAIKL